MGVEPPSLLPPAVPYHRGASSLSVASSLVYCSDIVALREPRSNAARLAYCSVDSVVQLRMRYQSVLNL